MAQLELTAPGDMVYLKHSPAMRSYVVLRGTVLLTNNVLDREGAEVRASQEKKDEIKVPLRFSLCGDPASPEITPGVRVLSVRPCTSASKAAETHRSLCPCTVPARNVPSIEVRLAYLGQQVATKATPVHSA